MGVIVEPREDLTVVVVLDADGFAEWIVWHDGTRTLAAQVTISQMVT